MNLYKFSFPNSKYADPDMGIYIYAEGEEQTQAYEKVFLKVEHSVPFKEGFWPYVKHIYRQNSNFDWNTMKLESIELVSMEALEERIEAVKVTYHYDGPLDGWIRVDGKELYFRVFEDGEHFCPWYYGVYEKDWFSDYCNPELDREDVKPTKLLGYISDTKLYEAKRSLLDPETNRCPHCFDWVKLPVSQKEDDV